MNLKVSLPSPPPPAHILQKRCLCVSYAYQMSIQLGRRKRIPTAQRPCAEEEEKSGDTFEFGRYLQPQHAYSRILFYVELFFPTRCIDTYLESRLGCGVANRTCWIDKNFDPEQFHERASRVLDFLKTMKEQDVST